MIHHWGDYRNELLGDDEACEFQFILCQVDCNGGACLTSSLCCVNAISLRSNDPYCAVVKQSCTESSTLLLIRVFLFVVFICFAETNITFISRKLK